jgi:hypothetical protein
MCGLLGDNYVYTLSFRLYLPNCVSWTGSDIHASSRVMLSPHFSDTILNYKIPSQWQGTCRSATLGPVLKLFLKNNLLKINYFFYFLHYFNILILKIFL